VRMDDRRCSVRGQLDRRPCAPDAREIAFLERTLEIVSADTIETLSEIETSKPAWRSEKDWLYLSIP